MRVLISYKPNSEEAHRLAEKLEWILRNKGSTTCKFPRCMPCEVDGIAVIGGDGTLLYTLSKAKCVTPPVLTIRAGRRAFLLDVEPEEMEIAVDKYLQGEYWAEKHKRLEVNGYYAINEVAVLSKGRRVTRVNVSANGTEVYRGLEGDGIIVSTTLGSTAYALSAGGPLVDPRAEVILLVPVNPIQLNVRSIVLPSDVTLNVEIEYPKEETFVIVDGVIELNLRKFETSLSGPEVVFARFKPRRFYEKLIELRSLFIRGS